MRSVTAICGSLLIAAPFLFGSVPASAQTAQKDVLGSVQHMLNPNSNDQNAYEQGRRDEMQREQAQRERRREWREERDRNADPRYSNDPRYGYRDQGYGYSDRRY